MTTYPYSVKSVKSFAKEFRSLAAKRFNMGRDEFENHLALPVVSLLRSSPIAVDELSVAIRKTFPDDKELWTDRALHFIDTILPPLVYLANEDHITFTPDDLGHLLFPESYENLAYFGIFLDSKSKILDLHDLLPPAKVDDLTKQMRVYLMTVPGHIKPDRPCPFPAGPRHISSPQWNAFLDKWDRTGVGAPTAPAKASREIFFRQFGYTVMEIVRNRHQGDFNTAIYRQIADPILRLRPNLLARMADHVPFYEDAPREPSPSTHIEALEVAARLLGYRDWHALQGTLGS